MPTRHKIDFPAVQMKQKLVKASSENGLVFAPLQRLLSNMVFLSYA